MPERVDPLHEQGTHHWILVLDGIGSSSGTCTPNPGETRYDLYLRIRATVLDSTARSDGPVPPTMFFDLQHNMIGGTMKKLKRAATTTVDVVRYMVTGKTTSARNRRALADYQQYQARERAAERRRGGN